MFAAPPVYDEPVIACTPDAIPPDQRSRWLATGRQVYGAVQEIQELPDGYACRLPGDAGMLRTAAEYVSLDRRCCAFVRWMLVIEPHGGPVWLHITGPAGTKELTRQTFETTTLLDEHVAQAAGLAISSRSTWVHPSDPTLSFD